MKKIIVITLLIALTNVTMFSGCIEKTTNQKIVYEGLRDAPKNPHDPNYQDFLDNYHKYQELYTVNIDGSHVQRLTNNKYLESQADVSPDGNTIVFTIHYSPKGVMEGLEPGFEIAVMESDGTNMTNLTNNTWLDTGAHWNHDGTKIVYLSDTAHRSEEDINNSTPIQLDVYIRDVDGSNKTQLTFAEPGKGYGDPSFSFNEPSKILYNYNTDEGPIHTPDLYIMDADGTNKTLILRHDRDDLQAQAINDPMFSPDGTTIIFEAKMGEDTWGHVKYHIFTVDTTGENLKKITKNEEVSEGMPQFSPDGTMITFDRVIWNNVTGGSRMIWLAYENGTDEKCLSSFHYESSASWFPNEEYGNEKVDFRRSKK